MIRNTLFNLVSLILLIIYTFEVTLQAQNLLNHPESVVFDNPRNRYLVSNWEDGAIIQIDSTGNQSYFTIDLLNQYKVAGLYIYGDTLLAAAGESPNAGIVGFNIETSEIIFHITIPGIELPNDITSDNEEIIYVTDYWGDRIYKIKNRNPSLYVDKGILGWPNGIIYDQHHNRLLVLSVKSKGAPIIAIDLNDSTPKTVVVTGLFGTDGIVMDSAGRIYVSEWTNDKIYRYENSLSNLPEMFSGGHNDPADIYYDPINDVLAVPNFSSNSVDFIPIDHVIGVDTK